jgi:hypothetical protein
MSHVSSSEAAKAVVRLKTEEVQAKGRFDVFDELFADDFTDHTPQPNTTPELAKQSFSDEELVNLTLAVITINGWNRLAISFRSVPGAYQPGMHNTETSK